MSFQEDERNRRWENVQQLESLNEEAVSAREKALEDVKAYADELGYPTAASTLAQVRAALYDCTSMLITAIRLSRQD